MNPISRKNHPTARKNGNVLEERALLGNCNDKMDFFFRILELYHSDKPIKTIYKNEGKKRN